MPFLTVFAICAPRAVWQFLLQDQYWLGLDIWQMPYNWLSPYDWNGLNEWNECDNVIIMVLAHHPLKYPLFP